VASLFSELGICIVNADLLAREVVAPGSEALQEIARHFGAHLLDNQGALKRGELRQIVFANAEKRLWLEQLTHPLIAQLIQFRLAECQSAYSILESPLLLETSQRQLVDRVLLVDVSEQTQLQRTLLRDKSDEATIRGIIAAQMSRAERLQKADDVIDNNQPPAALPQAVSTLHQTYLKLAGENK